MINDVLYSWVQCYMLLFESYNDDLFK